MLTSTIANLQEDEAEIIIKEGLTAFFSKQLKEMLVRLLV